MANTPLTTTCIGTDVANIACGDIETGTHDGAEPPPGSGQSVETSPSATGSAPSRYMQPSVSGVPGRQSGEVKLALVTWPVMPVIRSAARLSSRDTSPPSTRPEPLTSVNGPARAIIDVAPLGATPVKTISRFGPPASAGSLPPSGSKLAATPFAPHSSPAPHGASSPETSTNR